MKQRSAKSQRATDPSQQELPYGEWLKAGYRGREENAAKRGGAPRQPQGSVTSLEKPNREADPIQTEDNINHSSKSTLNAKSSNSQNATNSGNIDSPGLNDTEALMSELSGANILGRTSQTNTIIKMSVNCVHGVIDTNTSMNLVNIPVEYVGRKNTASGTIKQPREHSPDQGKTQHVRGEEARGGD